MLFVIIFHWGGYYNWLERGKFNSYVGYQVHQSLHDDSLNEFNYTFQEFWIWNEYITNWFGKEVILGLRYALPWGFLNGSMFSIGNEVMSNVKVRFTKRTQTEVFTKYTHYEFGPDGYLPDITSRDGEYTSTGIVHTFYFSNFRRSVFAAYILDTASTQGNNFDRTGNTVQVGLRTPVWDGVRILKDLTLELIGEFTAANYYHFDSQVYFLEPNARLNNDWSFLVRLTYPISRHWSVQAYYRYINANNKNLAFRTFCS